MVITDIDGVLLSRCGHRVVLLDVNGGGRGLLCILCMRNYGFRGLDAARVGCV